MFRIVASLELETMRAALRHLARRCHGDERPECPILDELADTRSNPGQLN